MPSISQVRCVLVVVLVATAGCSMLGGGTTATSTDDGPTVEGTPTAADPTPPTAADRTPTVGDSTTASGATSTPGSTPTATATGTPAHDGALTPVERTPGGGLSLPPGVDTDGSVNETRLLESHLSAVQRAGWSLRHRNGNDTTVVVTNGTVTYTREHDGITWSRGNTTVTNASLFGPRFRSTFSRNSTLGDLGGGRGPVVLALALRLTTADYAWTGTETADGTTLHRLVMTRKTGAGKLLGAYTGRMLVDERGRVHRLDGRVGENRSVAVDYGFDFSFPVAAVPEPPWFDRVPRTTAAKVRDGRAFRLTVTGGPALPAGAELTFSHNRTERTVTLDGALAPGESLYLALRRDGPGDPALVQSREPPSGTDLVDLEGRQTRLDGTVSVDGTAVGLTVTVGRLQF